MNNFFFVVAFKRNIYIPAHTSSAINLNLCLQIMGYLYSHATIPSTLDYWTPGASTHAARRITNKLLTDNFRSSSATVSRRALKILLLNFVENVRTWKYPIHQSLLENLRTAAVIVIDALPFTNIFRLIKKTEFILRHIIYTMCFNYFGFILYSMFWFGVCHICNINNSHVDMWRHLQGEQIWPLVIRTRLQENNKFNVLPAIYLLQCWENVTRNCWSTIQITTHMCSTPALNLT